MQSNDEFPCVFRDPIQDIWGPSTPYYGENAWPKRCDHLLDIEDMNPEKWVHSACVMCSNGCGLDIAVKDNKIVGVRGRVEDRINRGRLGPKGLYGWQANNSPDRLTTPMIRRDGRLVPCSWEEAMSLIADKAKITLQEYGPHGFCFYTSGQLLLEEYYTIAIIGKAGLRAHHMDGNTRLCTATAAASLRENFGCDGQPGSYSDIDTTMCILMVGHNVANTQTVLWRRILDRLDGPQSPALIVIDPKVTETAKRATLHLRPKLGTNLALLNGIENLIIQSNRYDKNFVKERLCGFDELCQVVKNYTPEYVEFLTGVTVAQLHNAVEIILSSPSLLSTCLQGVYQSNQATAAACQVNNINLLLGRIGQPGNGILQMNGQPTAQNNRETGCNGEFTAFRNYMNSRHMKELADHWKVEPEVIPHWSVPTHILQILSHAENGLIHFIWNVATNPLVSLPDLKRVRDILAKENIFIVVSDGFLTETADYADVVLPAALWGEKTGTFTNTDRTVHITHKAVDPPGQARSDLDIFLEFARRLDLKNKYGEPLVWWENAEETFEAWRQCTKGSSCDYSGITYEALSQTSGIQWPCNERFPNGCERLYSDGIFPTDIETCESFGHDLETGAKITKEEYEAMNPDGRAILKAASYIPPFEGPDEEFPLWLTTGRNVYHFHTRTKTGRTKLNDAEPHMYVEVNPVDAKQHGLNDGDRVKVSSRRGHIFGTVRIVDVLEGTIFLPFHYGYWDIPDHLKDVAANELTLPYFDPVSKQPVFKYCAVQMEKVDEMTQTKQLSADEIQPKLGSAIDHGPRPEIQKVKNLETHLKLLFMHCDHLKCILDDMSQMKDHGIQQTMFIFKHLHESTMNEMNNVYERYQLSSVDVKFSFEHYSLPDSKSMLPSNLTSEYQALLRIQLLGTHVSFSQFACNSLVVAAKAAMIHDLGSELVKVRIYLSKIYKWVNTQMSIRSPEALNCPNDC